MWLFIILFLILAVLAVVIHDITRFRVVYYEIENPSLRELGTCAIVSDLHDHAFGLRNYKLINALIKEEPNCIFLAGDILNATTYSKNDHAIEFMKELENFPNSSWQDRIYFSFGNHETKIENGKGGNKDAKDKLDSFLRHTGIHVLNNEVISFNENIDIAGLMIPQHYYRRGKLYSAPKGGIKEILGFEKKKATFLLAHNPEYFGEYVNWGAETVASGHIHGGIANLPFIGGVISPRFQPFPKFDGGIYQKENTTMVLSRGLSWHTIPVRFLNPGELVIIKFK